VCVCVCVDTIEACYQVTVSHVRPSMMYLGTYVCAVLCVYV
jgi:hypothetical protein